MLYEALIAASDLGRLNEIARVLVRHGFGDLVQRTGIARVLERTGRALHWDKVQHIAAMSPPERMRHVLEDLGPTFVKLGQVLAGRSDLLPPDWVREFSLLHEQVGSLPFEDLREQLEEDLGAPPEQVFTALETEPLAAGSIAQVHGATLADGRPVVLKIRRPGIREKVYADLRLLQRLAELLENEVSELRRYRPRKVVRQFGRTMKAELDFAIESKNVRAIAERMADSEDIVIPAVHSQYTRERLLVLARLEGLSAADWIAGERPPNVDPERIAHVGADAVLKMVFVDGLYHADPHPGNLLFMPDGRIGLLDFGMVGRLSEKRRRQFLHLLSAIVDRDDDAVVDVLLDWADVGEVDVELLTQDASAFLDRYHGLLLKDLDVTAMLMDVVEMMRENDLALPPDVAVLIKVFVTLDGLGRALDPEFDMAAHVEPAVRRMTRRLHSPRALMRRTAKDMRLVLAGLPSDLRALITRARRGGFKIELDMKRLERFGHQIEGSANRVTVGLITAALIVGTSIAMNVKAEQTILGVPLIALFGFVSSTVVGLGLLWSILRSGKR